MYLAFLDESGNTGHNLHDLTQPRHYIAAVLVAENQVNEMEKQIFDYRDELCKELSMDTLDEFHAGEIIHGKKKWRKVPMEKRIEIFEKVFAVLASCDAKVFHVTINKKFMSKTSDRPQQFAFQYIFEDIDAWIGRQKTDDPLRQRVLLVADENKPEEADTYNLVVAMKKGGGPVGSSHGLNRRTSNIVSNVFFLDSQLSAGIQLADMVAYVKNKYDRAIDKEKADRTKLESIFKRLWDDYIIRHETGNRKTWPNRST